MLIISPISSTPRQGQQYTVTVVSAEPGTVELAYSGPVTGPASVVIGGQRQYRYGGNPAGQYAARLLSAGQGQDRSPASWLIRLRPEDIAGAVAHQIAYYWSCTYFGCPLVWCGQPNPGAALTARLNWMVTSYWAHGVVAGSLRANYTLWASPSPTANPLHYPVTSIEYGDNEQYATACVLTLSDSTLTRYMLGPNGAMQTATAGSCSLSGTMGGTEVICAQWPFEQFLKYSRAITAQEAADWLLYGTIPSDPQIAYLTGHEIDGPQRVYDSGPMSLDLGGVDLGVYPGTGFAAPRCEHKSVDITTVSASASATITVTGAGEITISARRVRNGVPARASDSERYDVAAPLVVTADAEGPRVWVGPSLTLDPQAPSGRVLVASTDDDATVTLSASPGLSAPASVALVSGSAEVDVRAVAYGTHTLTATISGVTADTVIALPSATSAADGVDIIDEIARILDTACPDLRCVRDYEDGALDAVPGQYVIALRSQEPGPILGGYTYAVDIVGVFASEQDADDIRAAIDDARWATWVAAALVQDVRYDRTQGVLLATVSLTLQTI